MIKTVASKSSRLLSGQIPLNIKFPRYTHSVAYAPKCDGLQIENRDQVLWMKFDRPNKYNAITKEMYECISETFIQVNNDKSVKFVVLTGNGDYYSSGNDLANLKLAVQDEGGPKVGMTKSRNILFKFVSSLINSEKLLIAAVNGPAVGIPVTTLPLFDYVISSDKATFQSPFTSLGQCPEACASFTFPQIMGRSRASEILLLNMKWSALKAQSYGLVSEVVEHDKFHSHIEELLYGKNGLTKTCYPNSLKASKSLMKDSQTKERLMQVNKQECDAILECWLSEECAEAIQKFFQRSKK